MVDKSAPWSLFDQNFSKHSFSNMFWTHNTLIQTCVDNSDTNFLNSFKDQRIITSGENSGNVILINLASVSHHLI